MQRSLVDLVEAPAARESCARSKALRTQAAKGSNIGGLVTTKRRLSESLAHSGFRGEYGIVAYSKLICSEIQIVMNTVLNSVGERDGWTVE